MNFTVKEKILLAKILEAFQLFLTQVSRDVLYIVANIFHHMVRFSYVYFPHAKLSQIARF